jgi:hypothetical protein
MRTNLTKCFLAGCFAATAFAALVWWYLMPKGFPVSHLRFWANSVFPPLAAGFCTVGFAAVLLRKNVLLKFLTLISATVPIAASITGLFLFPESMTGKLLIFFVFCSIFAVSIVVLVFRSIESKIIALPLKILCVCFGISLGIFIPCTQRSDDPATKPCGSPLSEAKSQIPPTSDPLRLTDDLMVIPRSGGLWVRSDKTTLEIYPLLTFQSRSPDRFWTLFAPSAKRRGPSRSLVSLVHDPEMVAIQYRDDDRTNLQVNAPDKNGVIRLEAISQLPNPVYSHLNTFTELRLSGMGELALSFSPCHGRIAMTPFDYPFGRPCRLAYLDAQNVFHVVEASSGEKGPFKTLAEGPLKNNDPLRLTIYDGQKPVFRITLHDWAKQSSRQLSPTAGWGLPENAIEFSLHDSRVGAIFFTLAGTSVGRGWDSVGHAPGVYRNRLDIEPVATNNH